MDYSKLRYRPFDPDTVAELEQLPEFQFTMTDRDKAISYMILVWDPGCREWQKQYTRYTDLKRESALKAGFELNEDHRFDPDVEDMLVGNNPGFNRAVIRYLYLLAIPELPALAAHRELQSAELEAAFNPNTDAKERKEIRINVDAGTARIAEYEAKIFGSQEVEAVRTALYAHMEFLKTQLRPEHVATAIKQGRVGEVLGITKRKQGRPRKSA